MMVKKALEIRILPSVCSVSEIFDDEESEYALICSKSLNRDIDFFVLRALGYT